MPVIAEVFGNIGITKDDVDFICSGSTDYLIGGPFSFVMALDAVGVWPPRTECHVEMDGAWALYEAWVLLQEGEIDAALVYSFGRSSLGDLNEILTLQLDPYYEAPLWPDIVSLSALQARALIDAGQGHRGRLRRVASRMPAATPWPTPRPRWRKRRRPRGAAAGRLRGGPAAPPRPAADHRRRRRRSCWPPATRPRRGRSGRCGSPGSTTAWRPTARRPGPDLVAVDGQGRRGGRGGAGKVDVAELHAPFAHQELILARPSASTTRW